MTVLERQQRTGLSLSIDRWQWLLLVGVWLYFHSYQGLIHDARLYTVQALRVLDPARFANDLFFAYGSQDAFTVFPYLHASFLAVLGARWSGLLLTLIGQAAWLGGAVALFRNTAYGTKLIWGLIALAVLPADYGGHVVFEYGEGFVTSRLFAEALTLWALALAPRRRVAPLALAVVAAALHPPYGAIALALLVLLFSWERRGWILLAPLGTVAVLGLGWAGAEPFARLFEVMDSEWRAIVEQRNVVCFPLHWTARDYAGVALDTIMLVLAATTLSKASRGVWLAILAVGLGGLGASMFGDATSNLLLIQLQPSRALWLMAAASNFCLGVAAYELVRRESGRAVLALLSVGFLLQLFPYFAVGTALLGAWFASRLLGEEPSRPPVAVQAFGYVILVGAGVAYLLSRGLMLAQDLAAASAINRDWVIALLRQPSQIDGIVVVILLCLWRRPLPLWRTKARATVAFVALTATAWPALPGFERDLETGRGFQEMRAVVEKDATVFWHNGGAIGRSDAGLIWFALERTPYLSISQGAGLIFSRETAQTYAERTRELASLLPPGYLGAPREILDAAITSSAPTLQDLSTACSRSDGLDYVVLEERLGAPVHASFQRSAGPVLLEALDKRPVESLRAPKYFLYSCSDFR